MATRIEPFGVFSPSFARISISFFPCCIDGCMYSKLER